jgi:hypothetical protein
MGADITSPAAISAAANPVNRWCLMPHSFASTPAIKLLVLGCDVGAHSLLIAVAA